MARSIAVLVAAVLVFAAIVFLFPTSPTAASPHATAGATAPAAAPAAAPVAGPHPAGTIFVVTINQYGYESDYFETGLGTVVYFYVDESSGDTNATVTITDQNATRDGLTNPVATYTVNVSSGANNSYDSGVGYTLPVSLTYGGYWNITASGALGGNYTNEFFVQTYDVGASASPYYILPGFSGTVWFDVEATANDAPYTHATVAMTAEYWNEVNGTYQPLPLTNTSFPLGTAVGSTSFTLPLNATPFNYVYFYIWANVTLGGNLSYETYAYAYVGEFDYVSLSVNCPTCYGSDVPVGAQVAVTASVYYDVGGSPIALPNDPVDFSFWNGSSLVAAPGSPPEQVTTNSNGQASILFQAGSPPFTEMSSLLNSVNVSALVSPAGVNVSAVWSNQTWAFSVVNTSQIVPLVQVTPNRGAYFGGDTVVVNWSLLASNPNTIAGWSGTWWQAYTYGTYSAILGAGTLSGTSGTLQVTVPLTYSGEFEIYVSASNATDSTYGYYYTSIYSPEVILLPSEYLYSAGDTVNVGVQTLGSVVNASTLYYTVTAPDLGETIGQGIVTGGSFSFQVPTAVVPTYIDIQVSAQNPTWGLVASSGTDIDQKAGYTIGVGISTASTYADGSYQPGETITVTWTITAVGPVVPPQFWYVSLYTWNGEWGYAPPEAEVSTSSNSGSFSYTIPSGTSGIQSLYVEVDLDTAPCSGIGCYAFGQVSYLVNANPSSLNSLVGGSSGPTLGWVILLVIVLVVAVALTVLMLRRGRKPAAAASSGAATGMNPPAPPPSNPAPAEWKQPESSGDADRPAMPSPPPGAQ